jgi:carbamoyl-phosphate synthase small subunit
LAEATRYDDVDFVRTVTTDQGYSWDEPALEPGAPGYRILVTDCGLKYNILRLLRQRGCEVTAVPATMPAEEMLAMKPDGILLSPGPGDPQLLDYLVSNVQKLVGRVPMMGICLGHQILARAMGAQTFKLKFGHRGGNHPVKDLSDGRVYITAQNHGYAVSADSLPAGLEISHINLNDDTIEGLRHRELPVFTIQYHSEGSPGPHDNEYLFDRFLKLVQGAG